MEEFPGNQFMGHQATGPFKYQKTPAGEVPQAFFYVYFTLSLETDTQVYVLNVLQSAEVGIRIVNHNPEARTQLIVNACSQSKALFAVCEKERLIAAADKECFIVSKLSTCIDVFIVIVRMICVNCHFQAYIPGFNDVH